MAEPNREEELEKAYRTQRQKRWERLLQEEKEEREQNKRILFFSFLAFTVVVILSMVINSNRVKQVEKVPPVENPKGIVFDGGYGIRRI